MMFIPYSYLWLLTVENDVMFNTILVVWNVLLGVLRHVNNLKQDLL